MQSASPDRDGDSNSGTGGPSGDGSVGTHSDDSTPSTGMVVALGIVLLLVFGTATILFAVDRTALDAEYAVETMDEEGVYAGVTDDVREAATEAINDSIDDDAWQEMTDEQRARIVEIPAAEIREEYIKDEIVRNVEAVYAYIHGDREDVILSIHLAEPREDIIRALEDDPDLGPRVDTDEVRAGIRGEQNVTRGGAVPAEVDTVKSGAGEVGLLSWLLPLLSLGLVGVIYYLTQSVHRTATAAGTALLVVGSIGLIIGFGLRGLGTSAAESAFRPNGEGLASSLADGFVAVVDGMFGTIVTQSYVLVVAGMAVIGLAWLDKEGYFDAITSSLRGDTETTDEHTPTTEDHTPTGHETQRTDQHHQSRPQEGAPDSPRQQGSHQHTQQQYDRDRHPDESYDRQYDEPQTAHQQQDDEPQTAHQQQDEPQTAHQQQDDEQYDDEQYDELGYDQRPDEDDR